MSEEIITMLSNLGAIRQEKAVSVEILQATEHLKSTNLTEEIDGLVGLGYVDRAGVKLYLTKAGLLRALTSYS